MNLGHQMAYIPLTIRSSFRSRRGPLCYTLFLPIFCICVHCKLFNKKGQISKMVNLNDIKSSSFPWWAAVVTKYCETDISTGNIWGISSDLPRIPCRDCDKNSREGHGRVSGFTVNSNWKTNKLATKSTLILWQWMRITSESRLHKN